MSVHAADMDGDGDMDVLSASYLDDKIVWYENDGSASFTTHTLSTTSNEAYTVYAADMDGDGDLDLIVAVQGEDTIDWYANDIASDIDSNGVDDSCE